MIFDPRKLKKTTLTILAFLIATPLSTELGWVEKYVTPLVTHHPRWAVAIVCITTSLTLLHQPAVQKFLGGSYADHPPNAS